jgi:hypothetical protein
VGPARTALVAAAEQAASLHAVAVALRHLDRALALWPEAGAMPSEDEVARLRALVLRRQFAFLADARAFFADEGPTALADLAERLLTLGSEEAAARTLTLLGNVEWTRAERGRALDHLNRALAIFDRLPDSADKAGAHLELARLLMTNYESEPAIAAAQTAKAMARRLQLTETEANALVTEGAARYISGDPAGLTQLEEAVDLCRKEQLRALRRAAFNLAVALQEEGEIARSYALVDESAAQVIGDASATTLDFSDECMRAYFAGNWALTLSSAEEYLAKADPESAAWEVLMLRVICGWLRVLAGAEPNADLNECLVLARRGGFRLQVAVVLAHGALWLALAGDLKGAEVFLHLLEEEEYDEAFVSRDWLPPAAHAACLVSKDRSVWLRGVLSSFPRPTLWIHAALRTIDGGIAAHDGDHVAAAQHFTEAVSVYDRMGNVTDATLAATWAARAWHAAGDPASAAEFDRRVEEFAERNNAPGLLTLIRSAEPAPGA